MKKRNLFAGLLSLALVFSVAACGEDKASSWFDKDVWFTEGTSVPTKAAVLPEQPTTGGDVAVHDPSVFYDSASKTYYAFGTHYAVASSTDLIQWKQEASDASIGGDGRLKLYGEDSFLYKGATWPSALKESVETIEPNGSISTTWAPDVVQIDGRYYMYYSITQGFGSSSSLIGRVSSRKVMGPYSNEEILMVSHGNNGEPNCIDPELFYDKDGKLYMVYGSYFTGIFIKELNSNGLPANTDEMSDDYYGTLVWRGGAGTSGGKVVEGPFVFYNAENDSYYLMTTYGDLSSDYNMRIARSKSPLGPYTDAANHDLTTYSDANGVKLAGNYQFAGGPTDTALGHNSVIKKDGEYFVVCHVRNSVGGMHHLEVRRLFFNEDGWPVMAPNRYAGESAGTVKEADLLGEYDAIVHTAGTTQAYASSARYTLAEGGKVMKGAEEAGSWTLSEGYYFTVTLGGVTYKGVASVGWRRYGTAKGVYCMTATSEAGIPVWFNAAN